MIFHKTKMINFILCVHVQYLTFLATVVRAFDHVQAFVHFTELFFNMQNELAIRLQHNTKYRHAIIMYCRCYNYILTEPRYISFLRYVVTAHI